MAAATKRRTSTREHLPAPSGAADTEKRGWLSGLPDGLGWLQPIRERHAALCQRWAEAVEAIVECREEFTRQAASYRAACRDALAIGDPPPERPPQLDLGVRDGQIELLTAEARCARDDIAECVLEALSALREHRCDYRLEPLSDSLVRSLVSGSGNQRQIAAERARRDVALAQEAVGVEELVDEFGPTPDLDHAEALAR